MTNTPTPPTTRQVDELLKCDAANLRARWPPRAAAPAPRSVLARIGPALGAAGIAAAIGLAVMLWPTHPTTPTPLDPALVAEWSAWRERLAYAGADTARGLDQVGRWPTRVVTLDQPLAVWREEAAAVAAAEIDALAADARLTLETATGPLADLYRVVAEAKRG